MKAIAIEQWDDMENISQLVSESPARALKLINLGISEKIRILFSKNLGLNLEQSALYMNDRDFLDIVEALYTNFSIDIITKKQLIAYKQLLNYRHNQYLENNIRNICNEGLFILSNI